jgi:hypothetical protein
MPYGVVSSTVEALMVDGEPCFLGHVAQNATSSQDDVETFTALAVLHVYDGRDSRPLEVHGFLWTIRAVNASLECVLATGSALETRKQYQHHAAYS